MFTPDNIRLSLTAEQFEVAQFVARRRQEMAEARKRADPYGFKLQGRDPLEANLVGVCGEMVWSLYSGVAWDPLRLVLQDEEGKRFPDVGPFEVRACDDHSKRLILHEPWSPACKHGDPADRPYVLVTGKAPDDLAIRGWIMGGDGQRAEWWCDPTGLGRDAYFVPHQALEPVRRALLRYHQGRLKKLILPTPGEETGHGQGVTA